MFKCNTKYLGMLCITFLLTLGATGYALETFGKDVGSDLKKDRVIEGTIKELNFAQISSGGRTVKSVTLTLQEYPDLKIELPEAVVKNSNGPREGSWEGKKVKVKCTKEAENKCVAVEIKFLEK